MRNETDKLNSAEVFEARESNVRGYCRSFPTVFEKAKGSLLYDERGEVYIDFLAGAGTLNYGHNHPVLKKALLEYIEADGLTHGMDMYSSAKRRFLDTFYTSILEPREMDYKVQFTGPTGTNAVEAALKIARNAKGRSNVVSFTNGFHGMTLGSVAATGNSYYRDAAGVDLGNTTFMPYYGYLGDNLDTLAYFEKALADNSSGLDHPAAVIVESIQGEGGVNEASYAWLRRLERLCEANDMLLILDDIQMGCGRTSTFFSFEETGIEPDIITMSKSLSGIGQPLSVVLMKPHLDLWEPGQHNGTFRGNNHAFVTAAAAMKHFWTNRDFTREVRRKAVTIGDRLQRMRADHPAISGVRGRGMVVGIECTPPEFASAISKAAFERGLIIETAGADDQVVKLLPPLTTPDDVLDEGLTILEESIKVATKAFQDHPQITNAQPAPAPEETPQTR